MGPTPLGTDLFITHTHTNFPRTLGSSPRGFRDGQNWTVRRCAAHAHNPHHPRFEEHTLAIHTHHDTHTNLGEDMPLPLDLHIQTRSSWVAVLTPLATTLVLAALTCTLHATGPTALSQVYMYPLSNHSPRQGPRHDLRAYADHDSADQDHDRSYSPSKSCEHTHCAGLSLVAAPIVVWCLTERLPDHRGYEYCVSVSRSFSPGAPVQQRLVGNNSF